MSPNFWPLIYSKFLNVKIQMLNITFVSKTFRCISWFQTTTLVYYRLSVFHMTLTTSGRLMSTVVISVPSWVKIKAHYPRRCLTESAIHAAVSPPPPDGGLTSMTETAQMWKKSLWKDGQAWPGEGSRRGD